MSVVGMDSIAAAALRAPLGPRQADVDALDRTVFVLCALTGQDSAVVIPYLRRRAAESPWHAIDTWRKIVVDAESGDLDLSAIDWSA